MRRANAPQATYHRDQARHALSIEAVKQRRRSVVPCPDMLGKESAKALLELPNALHPIIGVIYISWSAPPIINSATTAARPAHPLPLQQIVGHITPSPLATGPVKVPRMIAIAHHKDSC